MYCLMYFIVNLALVIRVLGNSDSAPAFRIFQGNNANILNHPYMVSMQINEQHNCGGSLIRPNLVLTAAHCVIMNGSEIPIESHSVRVGTTITRTGGQTAKMIEYCVHPKYIYNETGKSEVAYDVAVVKLDRSLALDLRTQLIELQPKGVDVPDNSTGTLAGWGAKGGKFLISREFPLTLQEMKVFKINQEVCKVTSIAPILDWTTCFGSGIGSKGFCEGDSGGPLVVDGKQVGIVSYNVGGCGLPLFFPNVYTRVEHEEIHSHIEQCISKLER